ncbi:putative ribonuclease H-like domain-containing protein, partial [Tanacetum coccineum]
MSGEEPAPQMAPVKSPQMFIYGKTSMLQKGLILPLYTEHEDGAVPHKHRLWLVASNHECTITKAKSKEKLKAFCFGFPDVYQLEDQYNHMMQTNLKIHWLQAVSNEDANQKISKSSTFIMEQHSFDYEKQRGVPPMDHLKITELWPFFSAEKTLEDTNSINEVNIANGVSTAAGNSSQGQASSSSYTNDLMFSFFADQSSGPQLDDEDLEQINQDNLEEMDIKWQLAMLSIRVKRFYKKTGRKLIFNGKEPVGNVDAGYRSRDNTRSTVPVETYDALVIQDNALIVQDGLGYDWSYIAQDEPTEFSLMAYTLNSLGSDTEVQSCSKNCVKKYEKLQKQFDEQRQTLSKANLEIVAYQLGLESVEAQLVVHQKNEVVYEEKIAVLEFEVKDKGYGDQLNKNGSSGSELFNSVFDSRSSDGDDNQTNDRFKKDNEYHAVPPPLTGNYMPPLADLSFTGLDDSIYRPIANKTSASVSQVVTSNTPPSNTSVEMTRVESVRPSGVIIEYWVSDDEEDIIQSEDSQTTVKPSFKKIEFTKSRNETIKSDKQAAKPRMVTQSPKVDRKDWNGKMTQKLGLGFGYTKKACFVCGSHNHLIKDCDFYEKRMPKESVLRKGTGHKEVRPIWNNTQRINHQNKFVPTAILTRVSKEKVNIVRVNGVNTTGQTAVSTIKGNRVTAVKASAVNMGWVPRETDSLIFVHGNPQQALKYKVMFYSGFSRHMTRNKALLADYQDIDGGFVSLVIGSTRWLENSVLFTETECLVLSPDFKLLDRFNLFICKCLFAKATIDESKLWHRRLGHVNFKTMNKLVKGNLVRGIPSKTFENDHTCVACQKGKQHKASCKTKLVSSISQQLQMLHMDLFRPTSVRSINHKTYCLVVTDDFSRVLVTKPHNKTPYEIIIGRAPSISFMRPFGCPVTILNTLKPFWQGFDRLMGKAEEGFLVGYKSSDDKAKDYTVDDDACRKTVQEPASEYDQALKNVLDKMIVHTLVNNASASRTFSHVGPSSGPSFVPFGGSFPIDVSNLPHDPLMPELEFTAEIRSIGIFGNAYDDHDLETLNTPYVDQSVGAKADFNNMEPSTVISQALDDESWVEAMQEELLQFKIQKMDVKSAFLYGTIEEEVYVSQPLGFVDPEFLEKLYKVEKALYGLHQAPRSWYETLSTYLLDNRFYRGQIDKTLFIKRVKGDILLDKYVGEILKKFGFSSVRTVNTPMETNKVLTKDKDGEDVDVHLYRSMIGSLMYLTSSRPYIMFSVCACLRFQVQPKVSHLNAVKRIFRYLKGRPKLGLWYPKDSPFILEAFSDSDYAGASFDRKSTTGGCQFLGSRLISWQCKNQTVVANSTTEAEYIAASHCCGQNHVYHSKTKHIEIRHHFIRDSYKKRLIEMVKIHIDNNVADLLTKGVDGRLMVYKCSGLYTSAIWIAVGSVEQAITTVASLDALQDSDNIIRTQTTAMPNVDIPQGMDTGGSPRRQDTIGVLDLEKEKDVQAMEILRLKKRVKRLERQRKSSTSQLRRRKYRQVESSDEEDASKQGRKNDKTNPMLHESDFDGFGNETVDATTTGVSTTSAPVTTAGVAINVEDSSRPVRSITTLQPLPSIDPKDKGKASIDVDTLFAAKLQQEDREQYTIKERAKFLAETIAAQRKFRAAQSLQRLEVD